MSHKAVRKGGKWGKEKKHPQGYILLLQAYQWSLSLHSEPDLGITSYSIFFANKVGMKALDTPFANIQNVLQTQNKRDLS